MGEEGKNKVIVKNTLLLYFRQLVVLLIGLYTSRIVLNVLGVTDYGIYNVVGGVIVLFGFITNALGNATSRFIAFATGKKDEENSKDTFGTLLTIYCAIAIIILFLGESLGIWFVYNYLVIPPERFTAAVWVYHFSVLAAVMNVLYVPYNSLIIAYEKMSAFAYISVMDASLKLFVVYLLIISPFDKLIIYAGLLFLIQVIDMTIYMVYCKRKFVEPSVKLVYKPRLFKKILVFSGWTLNGNLAVVCYSQGLNILLNMFFGPTVNAARGIATQVQSITLNFVSGFQTAVNPQITKSYAQNDNKRMYILLHASCRFSYYLMYLFALPFLLKSICILKLWLKIVPDYTVPFLSLILVFTLLRTITNPINIAVQATGDIKRYQLIEGTMGLMILPMAFVALEFFHTGPVSVFWVLVLMEFITVFVRIYVGVLHINDSLSYFFKSVIVPIAKISIIAGFLPWLVSIITPDSLLGVFAVLFSMIVWTLPTMFILGLSKREQSLILTKITNWGFFNKKNEEKI